MLVSFELARAARALIGIASVWCGHPVWADCAQNADTFLSCTFDDGAKTLDVCLIDRAVTYDFGPSDGSPKLSLVTDITNAFYRPWSGLGRSISESVTFGNDSYYYVVTGIYDRPQGNVAIENTADFTRGEIVVYSYRTVIATLTCDPGTVQFGAFVLADAKQDAGQCLDENVGVYFPCN